MTARLSRRAVCGAALAALVGGALALPALAAKDDLDLVTRATGVAGAPAVASSFEATLSADGRLVAFQSGADNLSTEDDNDFTNVFVRDLQANTTTLVSRASGATGAAGDAVSAGAEISADGRFVAFHSAADNLSTEDDDDFIDVFVRDLAGRHHDPREPGHRAGRRRRRRTPRPRRRSRPTGASSPSSRRPTTSRAMTLTPSPTSSCATCWPAPRPW